MDPVALRELFSAMRSKAQGEPESLSFDEADLRGALLLRANLAGGTFRAARFDHANLSGARLVGADFGAASLVGAELNGADLMGANLNDADLTEARIEGVCLAGTNCRRACLRNTRGQPASVAGMVLDHETFRRSAMTDANIVQLWRDGAVIEDLGSFSERVKRACSANPPDSDSIQPHSRDIAIAEAEHRTGLMPRIGRLSLNPDVAPMSLRTRHIFALFSDAGMSPKPGDEQLGVTLDKLIGGGPNGSVWKAKSISDGRVLAIKIFEPKAGFHESQAGVFKRGTDTLNRIMLLDPQQRTRLIRTSAVALNGLGFVYDYYDNGNAMGIPVLRWDLTRTLEFFSGICRGVAELHEIGITHRALKPSNVLVDDALQPLLTDAGMVGFSAPDLMLQTVDTIYRAPEELGGQSTQSPTADIYSLGRILWFLLSGRDPDERVQGLPQLKSLQKFPAGILRIIRKATAEDPTLRYQWVKELEQDLAHYRSYETVGLSGLVDDINVRPYCISSLPAPPPMQDDHPVVQRVLIADQFVPNLTEFNPKYAAFNAKHTDVNAEHTEVSHPDPTTSPLLKVLAALGLGIASLSGAVLFTSKLPTPDSAHTFSIMAAAGIAMGTLLIKPYRLSPRLSRIVTFAAAFTLLTVIEPERLVTIRWKRTLANGTLIERAKAAKLLARHGVRDLDGAQLSGSDLKRADLGRVNFHQANLSFANLQGANLTESDLSDTLMDQAELGQANLFAGNIQNAIGIVTARCDHLTTLPEGWSCVDGHPVDVSQ